MVKHPHDCTFPLPGRRFEDVVVANLNAQFTNWLRCADQRIHATTMVRPADAIFEDRGAMLSVPPVLPEERVTLRRGNGGV